MKGHTWNKERKYEIKHKKLKRTQILERNRENQVRQKKIKNLKRNSEDARLGGRKQWIYTSRS